MKAVEFLLLFVAAAVLATYAGVIRGRIRRHGLMVLAWRWVAGHHWSGELITDAGWRRPGAKAFTQTGYASRWWFRPRRVRALWRSGSTLSVLGILWGLLADLQATLAVLGALAASGTAGGIVMAVRWWQGRVHRRQWVEPVHLVAGPVVGLPAATDPAEWLVITRDRTRVVLMLPPAWRAEPADRTRLVEIVSSRLAIEAPEVRWALQGPKPRLELTRSAPPPQLVTLADVRAAIEASKEDELLWGLGKKGAVVKSSLSADSPHIGLSMGSGAGKSVTARSLLAQLLHKGAIGIILDVKMISHHWAASLPNVAIFRRPAEIHAAMTWLGGEVDRRNEVALAGADEDGEIHADVGPRIIVVAEELNAAMDRLRAHWRDSRSADDPVRSPAIGAFDAVSFMGRQVKVNIVYIGQALSAAAMGGGRDSTENVGVIAFSRTKPRTWKMLAPDFPMPPRDNHVGRLQVVSDRVETAQGILTSPAEAKEFALSGVVSALPYDMPGAPATPVAADHVSGIPGADLCGATGSALVLAAPVASGVTLREAVEAGVLGGVTLAAVRSARARDRTFPVSADRDGAAELYDPAALAAWASERK